MTREEFVNETQRLQNLFNKTLNDTQLGFWYDELKSYELEKYIRAIGDYARSNKSMPALSDILSKIRNPQRRFVDLSELSFEKVPCNVCNSSGLVKYFKVNNGISYEYLCKCFCDNSKRYAGYPLKEYKDVFYERKVPTIEVKFEATPDYSQINF